MMQLITDAELYEKLEANTLTVAQEINWQKEQNVLLTIFSQLE